MTCRRKTKKERELVADIHKLCNLYCSQHECYECKYGTYPNDDCPKAYVVDLLDKHREYEEEEEE